MARNDLPSSEKILIAAQKEFAARGYAGARMEAIAREAGSNKAMLYYYFSSKESLYRTILGRVLSGVFSEINRFVTEQTTPAEFLEKFPEIYVRFIARNPDLPRILVFDLIHNPENVKAAMAEISRSHAEYKPVLLARIKRWHEQGLVSEEDPLHFMMNIIALSIFSFIGKPMVEAISGIGIPDDEAFFRKRIASVVNVLKQGMLK